MSNKTDAAATGGSSLTVTTTVNDIAIDMLMTAGAPSLTIGADQTQHFQLTATDRAASSRETATDTSTVMSWAWSTQIAAHIAARVNGVLAVPLDLMAHKTHLLALVAEGDTHSIHRSTDGATWTAPTTPPTVDLLSTTITRSVDTDLGLLAEIGGEAVAVLYHEDNKTITFFSSTDAGAAWADENVDIPSGNGPTSAVVMKGIDNEDKLYVGTREGLWEVDTAPSTWTTRRVDILPANNNNCRRAVVHMGSLFYPIGVSSNETFQIARLSNADGRQTMQHDWGIGGDGLDLELLGTVNWMASAGTTLFVSFGGGAGSRNGHIFAMLDDGSWHYMTRLGTANRKMEWTDVSPEDDGTQRLHFAQRVSANSSTTHFLANPLSHPLSGATIKRESGLIQYPYIDWGFPGVDKMIFRILGNVESLDSGTSGEYIDVKYGEDDGSGGLQDRDTANLGDFNSTTQQLSFPASGNDEGLQAKNLGIELTLIINGDTSDLTLKDVMIDAIVNPDPTYTYQIVIDCEATSEASGLDISTIRTNLENLEAAKTKVKVIFGDSGTSYKRVVSAQKDVTIEDTDAGFGVDTAARNIPVVTLTLEDIP